MRHLGAPLILGQSLGVNLFTDPQMMGEDELVRASQVYPNSSGMLEMRSGFRPVPPLSAAYGSYIGTLVDGAIIPARDVGTQFLVCSHGTGIPPFFTRKMFLQAFGEPFGTSYASTSPGVDTGRRPCMFNFRNETIILPGGGFDGFVGLRKDPTVGAAPGFVFSNRSFALTDYEYGFLYPQSTVVSPRVGCSYVGRAVFANFGPGHENKLIMCDFVYPSTYAPYANKYTPLAAVCGPDLLSFNGRHVAFLMDDDRIISVAEVSFLDSDSPLRAGLLVCGERTTFICTGSFEDSSFIASVGNEQAVFGDWQPKRVNFACGCISHETTQRTPIGTIWCGQDDVWVIAGDAVPHRIGTKIRPAILGVPPSQRWQAHAVYDAKNGCYRLALPTTNSTNDAPKFEEYWLDLRNGQPQGAMDSRWWGPQIFALDADADSTVVFSFPSAATEDEHAVFSVGQGFASGLCYLGKSTESTAFDTDQTTIDGALLWSASTVYAVGDVVQPSRLKRTGFWYRCTAFSVGGLSGGTEPAWPGAAGTVFDGDATWVTLDVGPGVGLLPSTVAAIDSASDILADIKTKDFTWGSPFTRKTLEAVDISAFAAQKQTLQLDVIQNQGSVTEGVGPTQGRTPFGGESGIQLGVSTLSASPFSQEFSKRTMRPDAEGRIINHSMQFRLQTKNNFIVDDSNDQVVLDVWDGSVELGTPASATVVHANYANLGTLMSAICTALNTAAAVLKAQQHGTGAWTFTHDASSSTSRNYLINLIFTFTTSDNPALLLVFDGTGVYQPAYVTAAAKFKKLMAMVGFKGEADGDGITYAPDSPPRGAGASPHKWFSAQPVKYTNPTNWKFAEVGIRGEEWDRLPLSTQD